MSSAINVLKFPLFHHELPKNVTFNTFGVGQAGIYNNLGVVVDAVDMLAGVGPVDFSLLAEIGFQVMGIARFCFFDLNGAARAVIQARNFVSESARLTHCLSLGGLERRNRKGKLEKR